MQQLVYCLSILNIFLHYTCSNLDQAIRKVNEFYCYLTALCKTCIIAG